MKLALAQTNPTIGDIDGNTAGILKQIDQALNAGADLVIFPEQAVIGYPAKDLLLRAELVERNVRALDTIAAHAPGIGVLVGYAEPNDGPTGRPVFNSAALLSEGRVLGRRRKRLLPTYDVFDDGRYFQTAGPQEVLEFRGLRLGVTICEDMFAQELCGRPLYTVDPVADVVAAGAELIVNISASPYTIAKQAARLELIAGHAKRHSVPLAYVNQVGGNDELLFDGASCFADRDGQLAAQARAFREDLLIIDLEHPGAARREDVAAGTAGLHDALVMGLRDYARKCGFKNVVLGLSGGIDSGVVAALAAEALGPAQVHGVAMPSRYSSAHSIADAKALAANLGIRFSIIEIESMHAAFERTLSPHFDKRAADVTEENIQARVRGNILMSLSNKFGSLLLTTGNKSELAVGYCTLYGDMCGGLAVISDVPKTTVYELADHINQRAQREIIPPSTLSKPPSAELRPDQTDQDSLPPYDVLDAILERYEERLMSVDEIVADGFERGVVAEVVRKVRISEYKRQQAAPGLKVTSRAFGYGRRMPIAARPPP